MLLAHARPALEVGQGLERDQQLAPLTFDAAFRAHAGFVASVALRVLGRPSEVDDLVQDVFLQRIGALVLLAAISASAWNLLGGYAGQVSVGHAVYFGAGAYASLVVYTGLYLMLGAIVVLLLRHQFRIR